MNKVDQVKNNKPAPKQARAKERQAAILRAADELLAHLPVHELTTTRIAMKAGVPVGSVYRYFDGKDDILDQLHDKAYRTVENSVLNALETLPEHLPLDTVIKLLLRAFWESARSHGTFRALTRWLNSQNSLWDVTPGPRSALADIFREILAKTGTVIRMDREELVLRTAVTTLSVLVDQAIEESDETVAEALIEEISRLLAPYLATAKQN